METKYVRVPFEVELARKITNGECDGRIVTRDGRNVRVLCWDVKDKFRHILALISDGEIERDYTYSNDGMYYGKGENGKDLFIEIPEYMTFKDGDVLYLETEDNKFIFIKKNGFLSTYKYVSLLNWKILSFVDTYCCDNEFIKILRFATEEEKKKLINELEASNDTRAKEYLERFFPNYSNSSNIGKDCEFKPFDKVLVRDNDELSWCCDIFSHKSQDGKYVCIGFYWKYCIPYNEQTAHLLGTTENY